MFPSYVFSGLTNNKYQTSDIVSVIINGQKNAVADTIFNSTSTHNICLESKLHTLYAKLRYPIVATKCKTMLRSQFRFMNEWSFEVSMNNVSFINLYQGGQLCKSTNPASGGYDCAELSEYEITFSKQKFKYFRLNATDRDTWGGYEFSLHGFDLFGTFDYFYERKTCFARRRVMNIYLLVIVMS